MKIIDSTDLWRLREAALLIEKNDRLLRGACRAEGASALARNKRAAEKLYAKIWKEITA